VTGVATQPILSWRATIGTIDASGLYTAPDFPTMDFVSVGRDAGSFDAGAHVVVSGRPPVLDSISGPAAPGDPVTVTGSFVGTSCLASFPSARGAPINVFASCSGNAATVIVPVGAQSGPLHIEKVGLPSQGVLVSNSLDFVRAPRILIHPLRNALARGDSVPISVTWLGAAGPLPAPLPTYALA